MERYQEQGLTHEAMRALHYTATGILVTRTAISLALQRYGLGGDPAPRYRNTLPWRVKAIHAKAYPARMLRLLGRRMSGIALNAVEEPQLDAWLTMLSEQKSVVAYDPNDDKGFVYVDHSFKDHKNRMIPIRNQIIHLNPSFDE